MSASVEHFEDNGRLESTPYLPWICNIDNERKDELEFFLADETIDSKEENQDIYCFTEQELREIKEDSPDEEQETETAASVKVEFGNYAGGSKIYEGHTLSGARLAH